MLNALDIAVLCDHEWTDGAGDRRTRDRSRRGIHPVLGDGVTPATFPTWDALNGRYTFDGNDYMVMRAADDVDDVLADMGSIQDETYLFYFDPGLFTATTNQVFLYKSDGSAAFVRIRYDSLDRFEMRVTDAGGFGELTLVPAVDTAIWNGKGFIIAFVRSADVQEVWVFDTMIASGTATSRDGSTVSDGYVGSNDTPAQYLANDSGIRFFGYGRFRATQTWLRQMSSFFRGLL